MSKKILIIDDDPAITESVKAILEKEKYEVLVANSGDKGLEIVKKENLSLVLCDMMMEKVDEGSKVTQKIKKAKPDLPVYLLSAIGDSTAGNIEIEKLGFSGVLQKPVSPEYLIKMVKKIIK